MNTRPRFHFTPPQNWCNDPNGLVYYRGEYHLFYQHNPFGDLWGHMSWGHAVSRDLLNWEHLPVALAEEGDEMIFSGSAVVDTHNTSGLGLGGEPPLIAVYTGHSPAEQTQNLAYSTDCGRTWTKYAHNPLIAIGSTEFRDPKVFWHAPSRRWIMLTVLSDQHKVRFDASPDLLHWSYLSDFGPAGAVNGLWECPDLFTLPVEGQPGVSHWVLKVDEQFGIGAQYFIGEFDGQRFINANTPATLLPVDHGMDFYAAQSWSDVPAEYSQAGERRIWLAWMSNWTYAFFTPTAPWRGLFTLPRQLSLRSYPEGLRLVQQPVSELQALRQPRYHSASASLEEANAQLAGLSLSDAHEILAVFSVAPDAAGESGLKIRQGAGQETVVGYSAPAQELYLDRRRSGESGFSPAFAGVQRAPLALEQGQLLLHIFVDACSVEVFANHGRAVISDLIFPDASSRGIELFAGSPDVRLISLDVWDLGGSL